jgi:hypothetical protein
MSCVDEFECARWSNSYSSCSRSFRTASGPITTTGVFPCVVLRSASRSSNVLWRDRPSLSYRCFCLSVAAPVAYSTLPEFSARTKLLEYRKRSYLYSRLFSVMPDCSHADALGWAICPDRPTTCPPLVFPLQLFRTSGPRPSTPVTPDARPYPILRCLQTALSRATPCCTPLWQAAAHAGEPRLRARRAAGGGGRWRQRTWCR